MRQTIIAVDDEIIILKSIEFFLQETFHQNFDFEFCESAEEAISLLEDLTEKGIEVPVIITDYIMPKMKGDELLKIVHNKYPNILSIMLTGMATFEGLANAINHANLYQFVMKPWDNTQLEMAIKKAIIQFNSQKEIYNNRIEIERTNIRLKEVLKEDYDKNKLVEQLFASEANLKETIAIKDKFFSIIAHDLRGPFTGFLGLTDLMVDKFSKLSIEDMQKFVSSLQKEAKNIFELLNNLLEWALIQQGVFEFNQITERLDLIVHHNLITLKLIANLKEIEIVYNIDEDCMVYVDIPMLNTVIKNLVSNAIKFTPRGGVIEIFTLNSNENKIGEVIIGIKDNGIGIPLEMKNKLFMVDQKVSRIGTEKESSTGLGLLLCKEMIEKNNGHIWVESENKIGSTFYFSLPSNQSIKQNEI